MTNIESAAMAIVVTVTGGTILAIVNRYFKKSDDRAHVADAVSVAKIEHDDHSEARWYERLHKLEADNKECERQRFEELKERYSLESKLDVKTRECEALKTRVAILEEENRDLRANSNAIAAVTSDIGHTAKNRRTHLLLVNDYQPTLDVMQLALEMEGYAVDPARDGLEAIKLYEAARSNGKPYSLIILDQNMPDLTGEDVAKEIRARGDRESLIMFLTARGDKMTTGLAEELGVAAVVLAPVGREVLLAAVQAALGSSVAAVSEVQ